MIGIASNGLHSNGFSLVHKVFSESYIKKNWKQILAPTRIYVKPVLSLLKKVEVSGIAHITGGAFYEKLMKIFPENCAVNIFKDSWDIPEIFKLIQSKGNVADKEMYRTFNMGVGMAVVVNKADAKKAIAHIKKFKIKSWVIGEVVKKQKSRERLNFI